MSSTVSNAACLHLAKRRASFMLVDFSMANIEVITPTIEIQVPSDSYTNGVKDSDRLQSVDTSRLCGPAGYEYGGHNLEHGQT